ncbi:MAG: hypothetical protein WDM85_07160 [Caulobacteraceae bacterium]
MGQRPFWPPGPDGWPGHPGRLDRRGFGLETAGVASTLSQGYAAANVDPITHR